MKTTLLSLCFYAALTAGIGITRGATGATVLGWNNLGMHCMDSDYSVFSILPPYNTIEAQLIVGGRLVTNGAGYTVTYEAVADPAGSFNSTSLNKGNFYQFTADLYAPLAVDMGLAGWAMPGTNNVPQPLLFEPTNFVLVNWFRAEGIPLTPYDDALRKNPYPMMRIVARDSSQSVIASNHIVLPVSDEMDCRACHASGAYTNARPAAGWVGDANAERDYRLNILRLHDERQFALYPDLYLAALTNGNFNAGGLYATVVSNGRPVLCASCHASAALGTAGFTNTLPLTQAVHGHHAAALDPVSGATLNDSFNRSACYRCHPGSTTRCLRGAMGAAVASDGSMAIQCQSCHGTMSQVGDTNRLGWLMEPQCQSCHSGTAARNNGQIRYTSVFETNGLVRLAADQTFATQPNTPAPGLSLYRFSSGHGGLQCEACHGSTHAEFPSTHTNDNVRNMQLQGHVGVLMECTVCHLDLPSTINGGPHGMHPVGQSWVNLHAGLFEGNTMDPGQCQVCHGTDYKGTVLSRAQATRTLTASFDTGTTAFQMFRGATIGCYNCHNGPADDSANTSPAPVVSNITTNTAAGAPVAIPLPDAGNNLELRIISQPAHGSVGLSNTVATYFPDASFVGVDQFTFAAYNGSKNSTLATATVAVGTLIDTTAPTLRITFPTSNSTYGTTNAMLTVSGTASDNLAVVAVTWSNDRGGSGTASSTANWTATDIPLQSGANVITLTATDAAGNSATDILTVTFTTTPWLTITINGVGTVSPNLDGQSLQPGKSYTLTAKPGPGYLFSNWSGSLSASAPKLTFVMQNSMTLQANFVPNPFLPIKGNYAGLFAEISGVTHSSAGFFTANLTSGGAFSGKLQVGGAQYPVSGQFGTDGKAHVSIPLQNRNPLTLELQLDLASGTDQITGTISGQGWTALVQADRQVFDGKTSITPNQGTYTLSFPGNPSSTAEPGGAGWGTATVDAGGKVRLTGYLADGTRFSQQGTVSKDGRWPLYVSLYGGQGSLWGWLEFTATSSSDLAGEVTWFKPVLAGAKYYPGGFTMAATALGCRYTPPSSGVRILDFTNGLLVLEGANLGGSITNECTLNANNTVTSGTRLNLSFSVAKGSFQGSMAVPGAAKPSYFSGAVLQKRNLGLGCLMTPNQSAQIYLGP